MSDLAKGKKFRYQLLYVQHVDEEKDKTSEFSEQFLQEYLLTDRIIFSDKKFTEYLKNPKANFHILKSYLHDRIINVKLYSNPLPIPLQSDGLIHAFVVFKTMNESNSEVKWWSLEKNGKNIILQQSANDYDVTKKYYDPDGKEFFRIKPIKKRKVHSGNGNSLEYLLVDIWKTSQLRRRYNLITSNCQNFASFVFKNSSKGKWSTKLSATVDSFRRLGFKDKKTLPTIKMDLVKYASIKNDGKFEFYRALIERRRKDFEELANNLTEEFLNSIDSQGYTLLEWATAFSTSDWPVYQDLKRKGAETVEEGLFRRNVFFIALQYLPLKNEDNSPLLSFNGIDINSVNKSNDTALHLALYGEKWETAEKILQIDDVNVANASGFLPLHLAAIHQCHISLLRKILARTNSENVNKGDKFATTALHYAIVNKSQEAVEELLQHKDVDINFTDNKNRTALHEACFWPKIPIALFKMILQKTGDVNAKDENGNTALLIAINQQSKSAAEELLKHKDVDVNVTNIKNRTALHEACFWPKIPIPLLKMILQKTEDVNAKDEDGNTALLIAINQESEIVVKELLKHKDVDVNVTNNKNYTALHFASGWPKIPIALFKMILQKTGDVNAKDEDGDTALLIAINQQSKSAAEELLKHKDVDINVTNIKKSTALHKACFWPKIPIALFKMILQKTGDVNANDENGNMALFYAIIQKSEILVKELLKHKGVNINVTNIKTAQFFMMLVFGWNIQLI